MRVARRPARSRRPSRTTPANRAPDPAHRTSPCVPAEVRWITVAPATGGRGVGDLGGGVAEVEPRQRLARRPRRRAAPPAGARRAARWRARGCRPRGRAATPRCEQPRDGGEGAQHVDDDHDLVVRGVREGDEADLPSGPLGASGTGPAARGPRPSRRSVRTRRAGGPARSGRDRSSGPGRRPRRTGRRRSTPAWRRPGRRSLSTNARTTGWSRRGGAGGARSTTVDLGAVADPFAQLGLGVLERPGRREPEVEVHRERARDDVAERGGRAARRARGPSRPRHRRGPHVAVGDAVHLDVARRGRGAVRRGTRRPSSARCSPCHGRAECACWPTKRSSRVEAAEAAELHLAVGRFEHDGERRVASATAPRRARRAARCPRRRPPRRRTARARGRRARRPAGPVLERGHRDRRCRPSCPTRRGRPPPRRRRGSRPAGSRSSSVGGTTSRCPTSSTSGASRPDRRAGRPRRRCCRRG